MNAAKLVGLLYFERIYKNYDSIVRSCPKAGADGVGFEGHNHVLLH